MNVIHLCPALLSASVRRCCRTCGKHVEPHVKCPSQAVRELEALAAKTQQMRETIAQAGGERSGRGRLPST